MSKEIRYYKLSDSGLEWGWVDTSRVPDLMAEGADIRTGSDLLALGVPEEDITQYRSTVYTSDQLAKQVQIIEEEWTAYNARKAKGVKVAKAPKFGKDCSHKACEQFVAAHPELSLEVHWYDGVRFTKPSGPPTMGDYAYRLLRSLEGELSVWRVKWKVERMTHRRTSMYDDIWIHATIIGDVRHKVSKETKDVCKLILKLLPTHNWKDKKHIGTTHLKVICEALLKGKGYEKLVVEEEEEEESEV